MAKRYARVDRAVCVACGTCVSACPKGAAKIPDGCWAEIDAGTCVGCGLCAGLRGGIFLHLRKGIQGQGRFRRCL